MQKPTLDSAHWLWIEEPYRDPINRYGQFHRSFPLDDLVESAPAIVSADQAYQLFVNGQYVCRGPARGYQAHWPTDTIDLAPFLRRGGNVIAAVVHNPGFGTFSYQSLVSAGFIFSAMIGEQPIQSDADWRCRSDPSRIRHTSKLSKQMGLMEQVDLRADDRSWMHQPADQLGPDWHPPVAQPYGAAPWHTTEPRQVPHLTTHTRPYGRVTAESRYALPPKASPHGEIRPTSIHFAALQNADWQPAPPVVHHGEQLVVNTPALGAGECYAATLELDQPSVGHCLLHVTGAAGGEAIDLLYTEGTQANGQPIIPVPDTPAQLDMATRITLAAKDCRHEAFQMIGHRCATLVVNGPAAALRVALGHRETRYPLDIVGEFSTDDADLQRIYDVSVNTQLNCMLDAYVDTPWREQAQWWGDARVQAWNTFYLADDPRLLRRGIRQIGDPAQEVPNGLTYGHAPTVGHSCILPDFGCVWMMTFWDHYLQTGSADIFAELWPRMDRLLKYYETFGIEKGQLVGADPRYWLFLDWTEGLPRTGQPALLNMMLLEALDHVAQLIELATPGAGSERVRGLAATLRRTINDKLWDPKRGRFCDGVSPDGSPFDSCALHTQVQAILCGLRPDEHPRWAEEVLQPFLTGTSQESAYPSPYWLTYVYEAARRVGLGGLALEHMKNAWKPMAEFGGTWERFDPPGDGDSSGSHAWSAHPIHHLPRILAGIVPTRPGWARICFSPVVNGIMAGNVTCKVPTPRGTIATQWERRGNRVEIMLSVPNGIHADVTLPGEPATEVGPGTHNWRINL